MVEEKHQETICDAGEKLSLYFKKIYLCIYLAALGLSCNTRGLRCKPVGSLVLAHRLTSCSTDLVAPRHEGSSFPHQGLNLCPLHCKVDSWPLDHQGSPDLYFFLDSTDVASVISFSYSLKCITQTTEGCCDDDEGTMSQGIQVTFRNWKSWGNEFSRRKTSLWTHFRLLTSRTIRC